MIERISEFVSDAVSFLLGFLKDVDLSPMAEAIENVSVYIKAALYLLPAETIAQIFAISCAIYSIRLTIRTITLIWNLLPIF